MCVCVFLRIHIHARACAGAPESLHIYIRMYIHYMHMVSTHALRSVEQTAEAEEAAAYLEVSLYRL